MPTLKFDPETPSIIVDADIKASLPTIARLALDTGASYVALPWKLTSAIGIAIDPKRTLQITTATTVETVPEIIIPQISVLGKTVRRVMGIVKDLPPESPVDGLLGLSFLKHFKLTLDFQKGMLRLE